jgi:hypothetical protein
MTPRRLIVLTCIALILSGCGVRERIFGTSGQSDRALPYRASLSKGEDNRNIAVRVRASGATVAQVRESVRFQATRYCLSTFGGSDTRWTVDPRTRDWAYSRDGDEMVFTGRCVAR